MLIIPSTPQTGMQPASISLASRGFSNIRQSAALSIARHLLPGLALFESAKTDFFYLLLDCTT